MRFAPVRPLASVVAAVAFGAVAVQVTLPAQAPGWHQWRGANRDGHSLERGLLQSWPEGGPSLLWTASGAGIGFSSFSASEGRLYTLGSRGGSEFVLAYDAATGKQLWATAHGRRFDNEMGDGPRSTPTVVGDHLYVFGARGDLTCLAAATGRIVWTQNLLERFDGDRPHWGLSESPLVVGDRLLVNAGARDGAIVALDRHDGALLWRSQGDGAAYSSAVTQRIRGIETAVFFTAQRALGVVVEDGQLAWSYPAVANRTANIATPIVRGTEVFLSSNYGRGAALLDIGDDGADAREVYFSTSMRNHHSSSVLVGDHVYGFNSAFLTALRLSDGKVAWRDRSVGKGSLIYADNRLYLFSERGIVGLAEATADDYREVGRFRIESGFSMTWSHPIISDGRLILRHQDEIYAYDIRAER
ncbi:MAG: PQQ-like beta-propeller repeat protein [Vicinamibacterales bacterium]|nr:PQQ-like beta-propeller repeat protein [Vicinamibacterales bacterium]